MKGLLTNYLKNFRGFSNEIWILTIITFINRMGAMAMPFLTKYLHENLSYSLTEVGWLMGAIGLGSLFGNWIGGQLTDKYGFYTIMLVSLVLVGFGFIALLFLYSFTEMFVGLFLLTAFADIYKPAMYVAVGKFSKPENRTRSLTLIRLGANLGIIAGPVLGGFLVTVASYDSLFFIDGGTSLLAVILFMFFIDDNKMAIIWNDVEQKVSATSKYLISSSFVLLLCCVFVTAFLFYQIFTVLPLYNTQKFNFTQVEIGLLLSLNGIIVFLFEMPIVAYLEKKKVAVTKIIFVGSIFMSCGFITLLISNYIFLLVISMLLITTGNLLILSFSNTFALSMSRIGMEGRYMALYSMSFSVAQIFSPEIGLLISNRLSFTHNWFFMSLISLVGIAIYYILHKKTIRQNTIIELKNS